MKKVFLVISLFCLCIAACAPEQKIKKEESTKTAKENLQSNLLGSWALYCTPNISKHNSNTAYTSGKLSFAKDGGVIFNFAFFDGPTCVNQTAILSKTGSYSLGEALSIEGQTAYPVDFTLKDEQSQENTFYHLLKLEQGYLYLTDGTNKAENRPKSFSPSYALRKN